MTEPSRRVGFRVAGWDSPLRVNNNRHAGRWNHRGAGPTQYIALHPLGTWAEHMRWHGLREGSDISEHRVEVWAIRLDGVSATKVDFDTAGQLGLEPEHLVADDWRHCQEAGERLRTKRKTQLIEVPSAALPGTRNLVFFGPAVAVPYDLEPLGAVDLPVSLVAASARPPTALLELVCHRGERHSEFESWLRGEPYKFVEPTVEELSKT